MNSAKMIRSICLVAVFALIAAAAGAQTGRPGIVPKPVEQTFGEGEFLLTRNTSVWVDPALEGIIGYYALREGGLRAFLPEDGDRNVICIGLAKDGRLPAEGYEIRVAPDSIVVSCADRSGAVYGVETLMQLIGPERHIAEGEVKTAVVGCQTIRDYPRFPYRGMHLDIARTFSDKAAVLRYIDNMSRHKLNKFHWHLVDDEGWRIEIKSYPRLTSVGAFRGGGLPVKHVYGAWEKEYGGFFTQDDIREVVAYAAFRGIEIIPEIDLPGHSRAVAKAYPEILCAGYFDTIPSRDDRRNVWCATREANYEMLDRILGEVGALFPSEYLHVGGDEVDPEQWEACPTCGPVVKKHSPGYLNGQFMNRLNAILARHGKKQAVWNEAMNGGNLAKDAVVYGWENVDVCRKALRAGYKTVLIPAQYFYFDMKQGPEDPYGMTWGGQVTLQKVYTFEPSAVGITAAEMKNIVGMEGAFWAEVFLVRSPGYLDYQTYPRICALSELLWTPMKGRNWDDFQSRLIKWHYPRLAAWGIGFRIDPPVERAEGDRIIISPPFEGAKVCTTNDGTEPGPDSFISDEVRINMSNDENRGRVFRFNARYGTAVSPTVYLKDYREPVITPDYKLTSSLKASSGHPFKNAEDNNIRTHTRTTTTCTTGDWFVWTFSAPVNASAVTVKTGANHMGRYVVPSGRVEVSYDGQTFETIYPEFHVEATIHPRPGLRAIRLTVTSEDNGESYVVIQDLKILR